MKPKDFPISRNLHWYRFMNKKYLCILHFMVGVKSNVIPQVFYETRNQKSVYWATFGPGIKAHTLNFLPFFSPSSKQTVYKSNHALGTSRDRPYPYENPEDYKWNNIFHWFRLYLRRTYTRTANTWYRCLKSSQTILSTCQQSNQIIIFPLCFYFFQKNTGYDGRSRLIEEDDSAYPALLERELHSLHRNVPALRRAGVDTNAIRQVIRK